MNKERLLKLADHLETGTLGHKVFDFTKYNATKNGFLPLNNRCGYMGCAIGECPVVWPDDWEFRPDPLLKGETWVGGSGIKWFDVTCEELLHLFAPYFQRVTVYGGIPLGDDATKEEVAANIRAFVARKEEAKVPK